MYESITNNNSIITNFPSLPFEMFNRINSILTGGLVVANWLYPFYYLQTLPDNIPLAYWFNGNVILTGNKYLLLGLPIMGTFLLTKLKHRIKRVECQHYPFKVTERNYTAVYEWARSLFRFSGVITQAAIFLKNVIIANGRDWDRVTRAKWVRNGVIGVVLATVVGYGGFYYVLKNYVMDEDIPTQN